MGLLKKVADYFMEIPSRAQTAGILIGASFFMNDLSNLYESFYKKGFMKTVGDGLELGGDLGLLVVFLYVTGRVSHRVASIAHNFFWNDEDKFWPRRQKNDIKIRNKIKKNLSLEDVAKSIPPLKKTIFQTSVREDFIEFFSRRAGRTGKLMKKSKKLKSPYLYFVAAKKAFYEGQDFVKCFLCFKNFLEISKGKIYNQKRVDFSLEQFPRPRKLNLKLYTRNIFAYFDLAIYEIASGEPADALLYSTLAAEFFSKINHPGKLEARILDSFLTSTLNSSLSSEKWKKTLDLTKDLPEWERLGESRCVVKVLSNNKFLKNSIVFKESKNLDDLINEAKTTDYFRDELNINAPLHLHITQEPHEGKHTYIMSYVDAKPFLSYLEKKNKSPVKKILKTLAKIHFEFPVEKVNKGNLNLEEALEKRINNPNLSLDDETKNNFKKGYAPLISLFNKYPDLWRYNKDAHPENWMISDNNVFVVDTENSNCSPVTFDLANLFGYGDYFSEKEMDKGIKYYHSLTKKKYDNKVSLEDFKLLFLNSLIHRAFFLSSAWSDPKRESLHEKRELLVYNAKSASKRIKEEYVDFYEENKVAYSSLSTAMNSLEKLFKA